MAHSLLGVVNELQNMEDNFLKILMEAALKLASLTDASLFVLCETQEGRRFAGQRRLCDAYRSGKLFPTDGDVEFEIGGDGSSELKIRKDVSTVVEEEEDDGSIRNNNLTPAVAGKGSSSPFGVEINSSSSTMMAAAPQQYHRKRMSADSSMPTAAVPWKQTRLTKSARITDWSMMTNPSECFEDPRQVSLHEPNNWDASELDNGVDVKTFAHADEGGHGGNNNGNNNGNYGNVPEVKIIDSDDADTEDVVALLPTPIERLDSIVERWRHSPRAPTHHLVSSDAASSDSHSQALTSTSTTPTVAAGHSNFGLKIEALKRIPGHKFEQTNSDEFKLLNSCMYEFGRILSEKYLRRLKDIPDLPHRPFFLQEYEDWATQFENIHPFGNIMIKKENKESKRTLLAYMRKTAGDSFGICIKKRLNKQKEYFSKNFQEHQHLHSNQFTQNLPFGNSAELFN